MPLAAALQRAGVDMHSSCDHLWEYFATHMRTEREKEACIAIGRHLKSDFFVLFVEQMFTVSEEEMSYAIERAAD